MARKVKLELTIPQVRELWLAARYKLELPGCGVGDGPADEGAYRALKNAADRLDAILDQQES